MYDARAQVRLCYRTCNRMLFKAMNDTEIQEVISCHAWKIKTHTATSQTTRHETKRGQ